MIHRLFSGFTTGRRLWWYGFLLTAGGIFCSVSMIGLPYWYEFRTAHWIATPARIDVWQPVFQQGIFRNGTTQSYYLRYEYHVGNEKYQSEAINLEHPSPIADSVLCTFWRIHYPVGSETVCYRNPENPGEAVLEKHIPLSYRSFAGLLSIFVGLLLFRAARRKQTIVA